MKQKVTNLFSVKDTERIKGFAIILLMIHHCFMDAGRYKGYDVSFFPFDESTVNYWALFFKICVGMFVFISGYGMAISYKKADGKFELTPTQFKNIVIRRYVKLITGYMFVYACIVAYSKIAGTGRFTAIYGEGEKRYIYALVDFFGLADLFGTPTYMPTFWYISLITLLIFIMPILVVCYKKMGGILLYLSVLVLAMTVKFTYPELPRFALCIILGMICADKNTFVKLRDYNPIGKKPIIGKCVKFVVYLIAIYVLAYFRQNNVFAGFIGFWDSIVPFVVIAFCYEFIINIPVAGQMLSLLGRYSLYIFLIHNFIRVAWYGDFTYGFKYAGIIVVVLLLVSLVVSVALDLIRKLIRFDKGVDILIAKLQSFADR